MKKLIQVIIIFIVLFSICITEQILVHSFLINFENEIIEINNNFNTITTKNKKTLSDSISKLSNNWSKNDDIMCLFVNHNNINEVGVELIKAKNAVLQDDISVFKESLNLILFYIDGYKQILFINFRTIL